MTLSSNNSKYNLVIGGLFGDEGKGLFTDCLSSLSPNSMVVRFSGGHQAGHTVVTDKTRHVFSNFGSGTLRNIPTYWSKYCTVEPLGLIKELNILKIKGVNPTLYIDESCPITTPYDIAHNRYLETKNNHGSCGVGVGATVEREERFYSLRFIDLFYPKIILEKLYNIATYYNLKNIEIKHFVETCKLITESDNIKRISCLPKADSYIFEGSQGLLLDQNFGFFPNVTRANTGHKNAIQILKNNHVNINNDSYFNIFYVIRAYQTRHGNGFMTNLDIPHNIRENPLETNVTNKYQGNFRKSLLDLSLVEYALNKDKNIYPKSLVITCLDQLTEYKFTYKDTLSCYSNEESFIEAISKILNIDSVYISKSDNSKNIIKFK